MQKKWKIVILLAVIAALNYADRTAITTVFPLLRSDLDLSDLVLAAIGSVFLWSYAIGSPIAGYLADRLSRTKMLLFSLISWSLVMALTGVVHSSTSLLIMRALLGIVECIYLPASIALIADHHGPETRGTAMGIQVAGFNIGLIGGSGVAGFLGERVGWRMDFFVLGGAGLILAVIAFFVLSDTPRKETSDSTPPGEKANWRGVWQLLRMPGYVSVVLGALLISLGTWAFLNWLPLYFYQRFHLSLAIAGITGSSALQIASILGAVGGGYLSDRLAGGRPKRRLLILAIGYFCAAPFLLVFFSNASLAPINAAIFLYSLIRAIGEANESPVICELAGPRLSSTALGILNMANCVAGGLGIMLAGRIMQSYGFGTAFGCLSATVALAGVAVLVGYGMVRRERVGVLL